MAANDWLRLLQQLQMQQQQQLQLQQPPQLPQLQQPSQLPQLQQLQLPQVQHFPQLQHLQLQQLLQQQQLQQQQQQEEQLRQQLQHHLLQQQPKELNINVDLAGKAGVLSSNANPKEQNEMSGTRTETKPPQDIKQQENTTLAAKTVPSFSAAKIALAKESKESSSDKCSSEAHSFTVKGQDMVEISSASEDDDEEDFAPTKRKAKPASKPENGQPSKKQAKLDGTSKLKSGPGRPKNSKNKGPTKGSLANTLKEMQENGTASIIDFDEISSGSGSRNLRSGTKSVVQSADHSSSSLKPVNLGFDFDVKKSIDPHILENIESCIMTSNMPWDDVIGLDEVKRGLKEAAVLPLNRPDLFVGYRKPPKGILLYGPPGTGKTMLGRCAASAAHSTFFSITASDIMSKWLGEAEKTVAALFQTAEKKQPSIIFIDEVDSLLTTRREGEHDSVRRIKTEFLAKWDGLATSKSRILVIGATNRPMDLDAAALRRFTKHLYVPLPEREARKEMLQRFADDKQVPVDLSPTDISMLGCETVGYSAADMANLLEDAAMMPMQRFSYEECVTLKAEELGSVTKQDIKECMKKRRPTCDAKLIEKLESWSARS